MTVEINCISHIREMTGTKRFVLALDNNGGVRVQDVLAGIEERFSAHKVKLLQQDRIMKGLLVFRKNTEGGLDRIGDPLTLIEDNDSLTLGTGMEGG